MGISVPSERVFYSASQTVTKIYHDSDSVDQIIFKKKALHRRYAKDNALKESTEVSSGGTEFDNPPSPALY